MSNRTKIIIKAVFLAILLIPYRIKIKRDENGRFEGISLKALAWQI